MKPNEATAGALASWIAAVLCRFCARGTDLKAPEDRRAPKPGRYAGRLMESLHAIGSAHCDHEPRRGGRRRASVLDCGSPLPLLRPRNRSQSARGLAHSKTWRYGGRFMESLHAVGSAHCDHEPTPNPSQEGNEYDADGRPLPSWEGSGVGRFMQKRTMPVAYLAGSRDFHAECVKIYGRPLKGGGVSATVAAERRVGIEVAKFPTHLSGNLSEPE